MVESDADHFRISSQYFSRLPWRTDVFLTPRGLDQLDSVPILQASDRSQMSSDVTQHFTAVLKPYQGARKKLSAFGAFRRNAESGTPPFILHQRRHTGRERRPYQRVVEIPRS